jgi:hypothetical protein
MSDADFRNAIRGVLAQFNRTVEDAIRRDLADPLDLGHSERLQFEVCPHYYGITLIQTEEVVLEDSALEDAIPQTVREAADLADADLHSLVGEELFPWFAQRWNAAGGPGHYRPAYAYYHGGLDEPRYDLERRRWCEVEEVWPGEG